jgi:hypothetical protein
MREGGASKVSEAERRGQEFGRAIREAEDAGDEPERLKKRREWIIYKFKLSPLGYSQALKGYYDEYCESEV